MTALLWIAVAFFVVGVLSLAAGIAWKLRTADRPSLTWTDDDQIRFRLHAETEWNWAARSVREAAQTRQNLRMFRDDAGSVDVGRALAWGCVLTVAGIAVFLCFATGGIQ